MTSPQRRRIAAALHRRRPDRVPLGELHIEDGLVAALARRGGTGPVDAAARAAVAEGLHLDALGAYPELADGRPLLGVHLAGASASGGGPHAGRALGLPDPGRLDWSPLRTARERSALAVLAVLPGPFGELAYLLGIERLLVLSWRRPDEARRLGEAMVDYGLELARLSLEHGAEVLVVGEDVAWDGGLLLRATTYRSLFLPALEREVAELRGLGAPVVFHSDGDVTALLDDLLDLGVDGLHGCSAASGVDLAVLAGRTDDRLCLWGNLDLDQLAPEARPGLEARVDATVATGSSLSGYVFGTSAGILDAALPAASVQAAFDCAHLAALAAAGRPAAASGDLRP